MSSNGQVRRKNNGDIRAFLNEPQNKEVRFIDGYLLIQKIKVNILV